MRDFLLNKRLKKRELIGACLCEDGKESSDLSYVILRVSYVFRSWFYMGEEQIVAFVPLKEKRVHS